MPLSMMARGLVMPDLALGAHYRHDPRQGGEDPKEKKTIGEIHFLAHGEIQLCQQSFICNTCSEHRWEFSSWICSQQLVIQCDDSGLSVSLQAKAAQTLLRQNFHFFMTRGCLALLALVLIKLILLTHSISEILYTIIIALRRVVTIICWLYSHLFCT